MSYSVKKQSEHQVVPMDWGHLEWYVSAEIGNSETMTVGKCVLNPGQANGRHLHPNCDEILQVIKGKIMHTVGDDEFEMNEGDIVSIPTGLFHNARNIGDGVAELAISFSSAYRTTVDEQ